MPAEGSAPFRGFATWYRVAGDLAGGVPVVVIHGGPGSTHDYLAAYAGLASGGRAVVHYDQVGNGRSSWAHGRKADSWTVEFFLAELDNLLDHLGLRGGYALLGHSWGGMLAVEHAIHRPGGLRALVVASAPASMALWIAASDELRAALPGHVQATLRRHEESGACDRRAYRDAVMVYLRRHFCRLETWPEDLVRTFDAKRANPAVYRAMVGPSELHVTGSLKGWSSVGRLERIAVPTLVVSGRHDEAAPSTLRPFMEEVRDVRWALFERSSHTPHLEEPRSCLAAVGSFLDENA